MGIDVYRWINTIWILVGIYWGVSAGWAKPAARREDLGSRVFHIAIMTAALALLFSRSTGVGLLGARLIPDYDWVRWIGLGLTFAGCAFAVWARVLLGSNWSATVAVKQNHELVRSGPYAIVRHPIYSGLLLGMLGTALSVGEARGLIALAFAFVGWFVKSSAEEQFMVEQFNGDYVRYRHEVKRLIPFVF